MPGFSRDALAVHFKLYEGYVTNANALLSILNEYAEQEKTRTPQFADIKRHLGWEMDGMRLHEYYFGELGGSGLPDKNSALYHAIEAQFGSFEAWKKDFEAVGLMRGIGWSLLYQDLKDGRLINMWINEHDHGHLAGGNIILPMDVFEHAYLIDYGLDRQGYIDAFFKNLDWEVVDSRYQE
ncbi:MAG: superoxide dismutase [Verrucomicrobia bacterium]|nr:superoxide dismutase [Verrucomicrobiota bacterium]